MPTSITHRRGDIEVFKLVSFVRLPKYIFSMEFRNTLAENLSILQCDFVLSSIFDNVEQLNCGFIKKSFF